MSVVIKLQKGGKTKSKIDDYLSNLLDSNKFTDTGYKNVQQAATNIRDLEEAGVLKDALTFDKVTKQYTVDMEKVPEEYKDKAKSLTGVSSDRYKPSKVFNKYNIKDSQEANSFIFSNYLNDFHDSEETKQPEDKAGGLPTRTMLNLKDFVAKKVFGGGDNAESEFELTRNKFTTEDEYKNQVMDWASASVNDWGAKLSGSEGSKYKKYDNLDALKNALDKKDWESFSTESAKLGWAPRTMLADWSDYKSGVSPTKSDEAPTSDQIIEQIKQRGLTNPELGPTFNMLKNWGITGIGDDYDFTDKEYLKDWMDKNESIFVKNKYGDYMLISNQGAPTKGYTFPKFSKGYGSYFDQSDSSFKLYTPETSGWDREKLPDAGAGLEGKYGAVGLNATVEGDNPFGTLNHLYGWNTEGTKDNFGQRDFLGRISFEDAEGKIQEGERVADKTYKIGDKEVTLNFSAFDPKRLQVLGNIDEAYNPSKDYAIKGDISKIISDQEKILSSGTVKLGRGAKEKLSQELADLIASYETSSPIQKIRIQKIINSYENSYDKKDIIERVQKEFSNGVAKKQQGGFFERVSTDKPVEIQDTEGTVQDMDTADWISLGGTVASFIPGVGAIGGAVSTGADLYKDLQDGKIDNWGQHLMNVGFTALSVVGLGGLKAIGSTTKFANATKALAKINKLKKVAGATDTLVDAEKIASKLSKAEGVLKTDSGMGTLLGKLKSGENLISSERKALEVLDILPKDNKLAKLRNASGVADKIEEGLNTLSKFEEATTTKAGSLLKGISSITPEASKYIKKGVVGLYGVGAIKSAGQVASNISEDGLVEGIANTQVSDVKNLVGAASLGKNWAANKNRMKSFLRNAEPTITKKAFTKVSIDGEELSLPKSITAPMKKLIPGKGFNQYKSEDLKKIKSELTAMEESGDIKNAKEIFSKIKKAKKIKVIDVEDAISGYTPNTKAKDEFGGDVGKAIRDFELAKKVSKSNFKTYGMPGKFQTGGSISPLGKKEFSVYGTAPTRLAPITGTSTQKTYDLAPMSTSMTNPTGTIGSTDTKSAPFKSPLSFLDATNIAEMTSKLRANKKIALAQKKSLDEQLSFSPSLTPSTYLRASRILSPLYDKQAANINSSGKRIAESTSDIDKALSVRLSAAKQATDLIEKGSMQDAQNVEAVRTRQTGLDAQKAAQDTQIMNAEGIRRAGIRSKYSLVDANKIAANSQITGNFLKFGQYSHDLKKQEGEQEKLQQQKQNYYNYITDPKYSNTQEKLNTLNADIEKYKGEFQKKADVGGYNEAATWDTSERGKQLLRNKKAISDAYKQWGTNASNYSTALNLGVDPVFRKQGGVLSEKIQMEYFKTFLNSINKDNELLQKSLIKVFK